MAGSKHVSITLQLLLMRVNRLGAYHTLEFRVPKESKFLPKVPMEVKSCKHFVVTHRIHMQVFLHAQLQLHEFGCVHIQDLS